VLVTQEVVDAADLDGLGLTAIGPIELKGVSEPLNLLSVRRPG
jgi:class 3 adenylate cyclase